MRTGRSYVATAIALGLMTLSGCAAEAGNVDKAPIGDWGDETKYPEIGGAYHSLVPVTATPTFVSGTLTVTSAVTETIIVAKRAVDSAILVNGVQYGGVTATTLKKLVITGTTDNQTVILDFLGGVFAPGTATARGIEVALGAGTDTLRIRGSSGADAFAVGTDGVAFNADAFRDIEVTWAGIESTSFALAAGNDSFVATLGGKGVTGTASNAMTIYGGTGNDAITGGSGSDIIFGGSGADTLTSSAGNDVFSGEAGADIITQGADKDGNDTIHCGTEAVPDPAKPVVDIVSYALRGNATARDETSLVTVGTSDGERVQVTVGGTCVDADSDSVCDLDANGLPQYPTDDGQIVETGGTFSGGVMTADTTIAADETDSVAADCESVLGGLDNDILTGDSGDNTLSGGGGNDKLTGKGGEDTLNGDADDDTFDESTTTLGGDGDILNGGTGTDTVDYSARTAALTVTMDGKTADDGESGELDNVKADIENLIAGDGDDIITGNGLNNNLTGGAGADTLNGSTGDDVFKEGSASNGGDSFNGGAGVDKVDYSARTAALTVTMDGAAADDGLSGENDNVGADVEDVTGGSDADSITGNDLDNTIHGGAGLDVLLKGGLGDDFLDGDADFATSIVCDEGDDIAINLDSGSTRSLTCEL